MCTKKIDNNRKCIRILLCSNDFSLLDDFVKKLIAGIKSTGAMPRGPIPMPTRYRRVVVNRSPGIYSGAKEKFAHITHVRKIDVHSVTANTVDHLTKVNLPTGITAEVEL